MINKSPFRKGYRSSWYTAPSLAALCRYRDGGPPLKAYESRCGCESCEASRAAVALPSPIPPEYEIGDTMRVCFFCDRVIPAVDYAEHNCIDRIDMK